MTHIHGDSSVKINLPEDVKYIIDTITEAGYEAFAVGGCIRDKLLGREPDDYDITTSATPLEVKELFRRTVDTGIAHGTVTVMLKECGYEVTTYRIDGKYEDNRHPKDVSYTSNLADDLLRRDFTINAMAYNDEAGLVDLFEGQKDIQNHIIRCVGVPMERFGEDALRIMRAVRFSAQLGYEIEEETKKAMKELAPNLSSISEERIQTELVKLVTSDHPENIRIAYELGLTRIFLPEFDLLMETPQNHPHHCYSVGEHTIKSMQEISNDKYLRLAMLFHDIGKPKVKSTDDKGIDHFYGHPAESEKIAFNVLKRLKFDNDTINMVSKLALYHDYDIAENVLGVKKALNKLGEDIFVRTLEIKKADVLAQSDYMRTEKLTKLENLWKIYHEVKDSGQCFNIKDLKINGRDLITLGYKSGPNLGKELEKLLDRVLKTPSLNDKEVLIRMAAEDLDEV